MEEEFKKVRDTIILEQFTDERGYVYFRLPPMEIWRKVRVGLSPCWGFSPSITLEEEDSRYYINHNGERIEVVRASVEALKRNIYNQVFL